MRTELFIEKYQVQMSESIGARINKSINDVRQFNSKNTAFTRTIKIPGTPENNKIFGFYFSDGRENSHNGSTANVNFNFSPHRSAKCLITTGNFPVVRGVIRLMNVIKRRNEIVYECVVYGELGGFISKIGEKKLTDLDFSAYNNTWSFNNIAFSWTQFGTGSGVAYPMIDYGLCSVNKLDYNQNAFRPAFYLKEYIDKIFAASGYTYDCPFFDSAFFKKIVIPHNEDDLYKLVNQLMDRHNTTAINSWISYQNNYATQVKVPFLAGTMANFSANGAFDEFTYTGSTTSAATLTYNVQAEFRAQAASATQYVATFRVLVNGVAVGYHTIQLIGENPPTIWHQINLANVVNITLNPGDIVKIDAIASTNPFTGSPLAFWINFKSSDIKIDPIGVQAAPAAPGDMLSMNNCIPKNIKQYDLLDSVINAFNLHIVEDKFNERKLVIRPYPLFYNTAMSSRIDWTNKVDRSEDVSIVPMGELTARQFNFKYDVDSDYFNETYKSRRGLTYGDRSLDTFYEFGKEVKDVKLMFAPTVIVAAGSVDKPISTIYKFDSNGEQRMGSKIRMLMVKMLSSVATYELQNWVNGIGKIDCALGSTTVNGSGTNFTVQCAVGDKIISKGKVIGTVASIGSATQLTLGANATASTSGDTFFVAKFLQNIVNQFPYAGHLDDPKTPTQDLNWSEPKEVFYTLSNPYTGNNLFNVYWKHFIEEINNPKSALFNYFVKLTAEDLYNLDFSRYIHVDGTLFRLNKVIDYDTESPLSTKVELLKVIKPLT